MSAHAYPLTIENGAGERITFARHIQDPAGDRLEGENLVKPGNETIRGWTRRKNASSHPPPEVVESLWTYPSS